MTPIHAAAALLLVAATQAADPNAPPSAVQVIRDQAKSLEPLVTSELARGFLKAASALPAIESRRVMRDKTTRKVYGLEEAKALDEATRQGLEEIELDERFYY